MSASCLNFQPHFAKPISHTHPNSLQLRTTTVITRSRHLQTAIHPRVRKHHLSFTQLRSRVLSARIMGTLGAGNCDQDQHSLANIMRSYIRLFRSFAPGGNWWKLRDSVEGGEGKGKSVTVPSALWRIWLLLSDDRWIIIAAFASVTIAALSEISMPSLLAASIFAVKNHETVVFHRNCRMLALLCLTSGIFSGLRGGCFGIANSILVKRLRETLYPILLFQDISFFDAEPVGRLTSRLGADCQRLSFVVGNNIHLIFRNILQGTGAFINLMLLSWPLAFSSLAVSFILAFIFVIYGGYQKEAAKFNQELEATANHVARDAFYLIRTVRVHGTEDEEVERYKHWLNKIAFVNLRESIAYGLWNLSFNGLYRSTQIIAVALGAVSVSMGHITPEQLLKYILYCEWLIFATWRLVDNAASLYQCIGASEIVFQMLDVLPSNQFSVKGVKLQQLNGHIELVDVSFCYPTRAQIPVLEHVNVAVQANEVVAIVGPSGSGKSSLIKLLLGLYEPTDGVILIDGVPINKLDARWLRDQMGYVGQEPELMRRNVKSNISYGCRGYVRHDDIVSAAKLANAHDFISSLPNGYDTLVNDNLLSGGQKQKIAIARAILRNPKILILDEPTSALDVESEHHITGVLEALKVDSSARRTVIVIAHRLSTVRVADRILVMDGGKIVEMGSHKELVEKKGLYSRLVEMQRQVLTP